MVYSSAIGIDLGTTHTVASIYEDGQPVIIPNLNMERLTPSLVFYNPRNLHTSVGNVAKEESLKCPRNFMFDVKRIIGRNYYDIYVQNFVKMEESCKFPFRIIKSEEETSDEFAVELQTQNKKLKVTKSPEEITSVLLKYIKDSVKSQVGADITDAVISVPAYFSYAQRAAIKRAAEMIGYNVLKLITEPVAAAINYTFRKPWTNENLLMFDLGGGTLDVSIISVTAHRFAVRSIHGDMFLGGRDFDDIIFDYLRVEVARKYGNQYVNQETRKGQRMLHKLRKYAKRYKEMLTYVTKYSRPIEIDDDDFEVVLTRQAFEILCEELFQRCIDKVKQCLQSANMRETDINKVVLVGGCSRIPKVLQLLSEMFSDIEISTDINADEAVALGAGIHAALIKGEIENREMLYEITEVAPFTIGMQAKYDLMVEYIRKGTDLPATTSQIMSTSDNNQKAVDFVIIEGERKNCQHNNRLGAFSITNLPLGKCGDIKFDVKFHLDEDGVLEVSAMETFTKTKKELTINMQHLTLCSNTKSISLEEENKLIAEDKLYDQFYRLRLQAETFCKDVLHDLENANVRVGLIIERECANFLKNIEHLECNEIESLRSQFEALTTRTRRTFFENGRGSEFGRIMNQY